MRFPFLVALITSIALAATVWYQNTKTICPTPLAYKVNQIDSHFNLSLETARAHVAAAEAVWEKGAGRDLFYYDENAELIIDFVFDDRQAMADSEISQKQQLDSKRDENDALRKTIEELQKEYEEDASAYKRAVDAYERDLTAYNNKVQSYNDQGGAPPEAYDELEAEKNSLNRTSGELDATSDRLNELASKINELGNNSNKLVDEYNREVEAYNEQFGFSREFTQGDYFDGTISIYKFSNERELVAVLTHELGHALGIEHVEGESSVMYYLLEDSDSTPVLSAEDTKAFMAVCGTGESIGAQVRLTIRNTLQALNF
jgi:archaellum component FlaC